MKPIHGIPVKSLPCPGAESFMPFMGYQEEKCQRVFIYFVFIVFHLFSGERHASPGAVSRPVDAMVMLFAIFFALIQITFFPIWYILSAFSSLVQLSKLFCGLSLHEPLGSLFLEVGQFHQLHLW